MYKLSFFRNLEQNKSELEQKLGASEHSLNNASAQLAKQTEEFRNKKTLLETSIESIKAELQSNTDKHKQEIADAMVKILCYVKKENRKHNYSNNSSIDKGLTIFYVLRQVCLIVCCLMCSWGACNTTRCAVLPRVRKCAGA